MTDKEILDEVINCANLYKNNLEKNNIMFVFQNKQAKNIEDSIQFIETIYYPTNFLHLTGLKARVSSTLFYERATTHNLAINDIKIKNRYMTELKLGILKNLMSIEKSTKSVGDFDNTIKDKLYTEKVVGNVHYCMGYVKDDETGYFYTPNSSLREDIRDITNNNSRIIAILKKEQSKEFYNVITYIVNDINLNCLLRNNNLANLIDFEHIEYAKTNDKANLNKVEQFRKDLIETVNNFKKEILERTETMNDETQDRIIEDAIDKEADNDDMDYGY